MNLSIADLPDWREGLGAGDARNPCMPHPRLHGVFRTSHPVRLRLRTCLATREIKYAELMAWRRICRRRFETASKPDRLNLAALNLGHDAPLSRREHDTLSHRWMPRSER